ncbi:MAG: nitroreductase family protein [Phycisphaerae bacterium]|jgi:nitroreductase
MIEELIRRNRSYRRFDENFEITADVLRGLIDLARLSPSASNMQPLKYIISNDKQKNALIFPNLGWAGYLTDWPGPGEGERPVAYIVILGDTRISKTFNYDFGIAAQSILLGAVYKGLGGCMVATIKKKELAQALNIAACFEILLVIALGKPAEKIVIEQVSKDGNIKYWRDEKQVHHVPKRSLDEIIIE